MTEPLLTETDFYNILDVKGLNPKPRSIPYWILKSWCEDAMIPLDKLIENKLSSYEKLIIKTISDEVRHIIISEGKKLTLSAVRKKVNWYMRDKQDNGTKSVNRRTGETIILKSKIEPNPFLIQKIAERIQEKTQKFVIPTDEESQETLDSIFKLV